MGEDAQTEELFNLAERISKEGEFVSRGGSGCNIFVGKREGKQYRVEYEPSPGYDCISIYGPDGFLSSLNMNMWDTKGRNEYSHNGEISQEELRNLLENLEKDDVALNRIRENYLRSFSRGTRREHETFFGERERRMPVSDVDSSDSDLTKRAFGASALGYLFLGPIGLLFGPALINKERKH
ncbi:hypothetical protein HY449_00740 [Candidatus Pacearchaeota archaeon]|nr:hypothetical protein [Candidatus Pacearchaeota archaeon]